MKVATASQMQNLDRRAIQEFGIPGVVLMENAGRATVEAMGRHFPDLGARKVIVFAGPGNNGGDGFVIGRHLLNRGVEVTALLLSAREKVSGDARTNLELYEKLRPLHEVHDFETLARYEEEISRAGLLVDAILGTGLKSEVTGFYREVISLLNRRPTPVVAVDIPSGLDATTGKVLGVAVEAELTVTFGLPKLGLVLTPGSDLTGTLEVADISIPRFLVEEEQIKVELLEAQELFSLLKPRRSDSHKGHYGHVLVIAGSVGKTGAAVMTSESALRIGAGLVTAAIPASLNPIMEVKLTEVMTEPLPETDAQSLSSSAWTRIQQLMEGKKVIALGPGISTHPETVALARQIVAGSTVPLVIDADGVNALAEEPHLLKEARVPVVLTPHPGEMARMVKCSIAEVQANRLETAQEFARRHQVVVVLKGARTIIADPEGHTFINPTGNPGLASGGTGDVLTGMIAGLASQGHSLMDASRLGVYLHGLIADRVAVTTGEMGLSAMDLVAGIARTLNEASGHGICD